MGSDVPFGEIAFQSLDIEHVPDPMALVDVEEDDDVAVDDVHVSLCHYFRV
jgi:hypothetical protein